MKPGAERAVELLVDGGEEVAVGAEGDVDGGVALSLPSGRGQTHHQIKQPLHLIGAEQVIGALRGDACERGLVDPSRFHDAVVGEVVDDEVDEGDYVGSYPDSSLLVLR